MSTKIVQTRFGGPEVLESVDQAPPTRADLAADEVLVRVAYAGVNPVDVMTRTGGGMAAAGLVTLPFTPGWDLAGTVEAVGRQVSATAPYRSPTTSTPRSRPWPAPASTTGCAASGPTGPSTTPTRPPSTASPTTRSTSLSTSSAARPAAGRWPRSARAAPSSSWSGRATSCERPRRRRPCGSPPPPCTRSGTGSARSPASPRRRPWHPR